MTHLQEEAKRHSTVRSAGNEQHRMRAGIPVHTHIMHVHSEAVKPAILAQVPLPFQFDVSPEGPVLRVVSEPDPQTDVAKASLLRIRSLLSEARQRALEDTELKELQEQCDTIYPGLPNREEFTLHVQRFCLSIFGCGILVTGACNGAEEFYEDACELLALLDEREDEDDDEHIRWRTSVSRGGS